jgi:putative inorganic carbon (HCO3(-)) transporter
MIHRTAAAFALAGLLAAWLVGLTFIPAPLADTATPLFPLAVGAVAALSVMAMVWWLDPAYALSGAILLTPFAGNWPQLGVPGPLSPDRLLLAAGILGALLPSPATAGRPRLRITGAHWLLALAACYALTSAFVVGTLHDRDAVLKIVDAFGIMPFLLFLVAPVVFRTQRQRRLLLGTLVVLGSYLAPTVIFEMSGVDALVFPKYILDATYGIHVERGRGPFADAVANGLALYACAVACGIAAATWRTWPARAYAVMVGLLCIVGAFLSLERSVWIGAVFGTSLAMLATRGLRRYMVIVLVAGAAAIGSALLVIPGLYDTVHTRVTERGILWDRKNLARAALNMVEARPLFGFGWSRFTAESDDYFQQSFDYPLTATHAGVHNTPLTYAVDLGLVGMSLWLLGVVLGVGGALATRGPPDLLPWRVGLLAIASAYLVVMSSVPPTTWLNRSLWLFAGVVYAGRYRIASASQV